MKKTTKKIANQLRDSVKLYPDTLVLNQKVFANLNLSTALVAVKCNHKCWAIERKKEQREQKWFSVKFRCTGFVLTFSLLFLCTAVPIIYTLTV